MAARIKKIEVPGFDKVFEVRELTVNQLMELFESLKGLSADKSVVDFLTLDVDLLAMVSNAKLVDLKAMAPSEIELLYDGFMEVNASFFKVARSLGMNVVIDQLRAALVSDFYGLLSNAVEPGSTEQGNSSIENS